MLNLDYLTIQGKGIKIRLHENNTLMNDTYDIENKIIELINIIFSFRLQNTSVLFIFNLE